MCQQVKYYYTLRCILKRCIRDIISSSIQYILPVYSFKTMLNYLCYFLHIQLYMQNVHCSLTLYVPIGKLLLYIYLIFRLQSLFECGLIDLWTRKYFPRDTKCTHLSRPSTHYHSVDVDDVMGAFLVLCTGLAAAFLTFAAELCYYLICCKCKATQKISHKQHTMRCTFL